MVYGLEAFTRHEIETACAQLEITEPAPYAPRMPSLAELLAACRNAKAQRVSPSRFCGRCWNGHIRLGGEVVMCECCCRECGGSGYIFSVREGATFARLCECRKRAIA